MKIKFGSLVVDGRGKIGGHVASKNRGGSYLRTKVTPVNPQTTAQQNVRNSFTDLSQGWRGLTANQRLEWNNAVSNYTRTNIFGDLRTPSGKDLFQRLNGNLLAAGQATINSPVMPQGSGSFTSFTMVADTTGGGLDLTFAPTIPAGMTAIVTATAPVSPGVSFVKNKFRQIDELAAGTTSPQDVAAAYIAKFGALPAIGSKVFVKMDIVNNTSGERSVPIQAESIAS